MDVETRAHTALHIVKGALVRALGEEARWTVSTWVQGERGRLTVEFPRRPSAEELGLVQRLVDAKVEEDTPVEVYELPRGEAEDRWGDAIYDRFPLPSQVRVLQVVCIPGWNVNACNKSHTRTTREVGRVEVLKTRYRPSRGHLEVSFRVS